MYLPQAARIERAVRQRINSAKALVVDELRIRPPSYSSHLSPSTINCIASVHPAMTPLGAKFAGEPRSKDESNFFPLGSLDHSRAVRPS